MFRSVNESMRGDAQLSSHQRSGFWSHPSSAQRQALIWTLTLAIGALLFALATSHRTGLGAMAKFVVLAVVLAVVLTGSLLVVRALPRSHVPGADPAMAYTRYGAANGLTHVRLGMAALLAGLAAEAALGLTHSPGLARTPEPNLAWGVFAFAGLAALLDAVDGPLARRQGLASALGARFDMEVDAFFVLVLALLCWLWGKAGVWVLCSGALRYLFVAAGWRWHWLAAPLAPSKRRQTVCVLQVVALIASLMPTVTPSLSTSVAGLGLVLLVGSFAIDVVVLRRAHCT